MSTDLRHDTPWSQAPNPALSREERAVLAAIRETAFGAVEVVLHQSRVVQVIRTERVRFDSTGRDP